MSAADLPFSPFFQRSMRFEQLLMFAEWISVPGCTYSVSARDRDAMDYSLVAVKRRAGAEELIRASVAWGRQERAQANRLVQDRYAWRGYIAAGGHENRLPFDDPCAITLIAESGGTTVGTMTVGLDGPRGLLVDESYPDQMAVVRSKGRKVCELTRLALAEKADTKTVLSTMFGLAYGVASALQDVTDVFIEVNPRHVAFYRRVLGFVVAAGERLCERVQAPAVLLCISVEELEAALRSYCTQATASVAAPAPFVAT